MKFSLATVLLSFTVFVCAIGFAEGKRVKSIDTLAGMRAEFYEATKGILGPYDEYIEAKGMAAFFDRSQDENNQKYKKKRESLKEKVLDLQYRYLRGGERNGNYLSWEEQEGLREFFNPSNPIHSKYLKEYKELLTREAGENYAEYAILAEASDYITNNYDESFSLNQLLESLERMGLNPLGEASINDIRCNFIHKLADVKNKCISDPLMALEDLNNLESLISNPALRFSEIDKVKCFGESSAAYESAVHKVFDIATEIFQDSSNDKCQGLITNEDLELVLRGQFDDTDLTNRAAKHVVKDVVSKALFSLNSSGKKYPAIVETNDCGLELRQKTLKLQFDQFLGLSNDRITSGSKKYSNFIGNCSVVTEILPQSEASSPVELSDKTKPSFIYIKKVKDIDLGAQ